MDGPDFQEFGGEAVALAVFIKVPMVFALTICMTVLVVDFADLSHFP